MREDFELGQYIVKHEFSGVDNNLTGKKKGNGVHVAGGCLCVFMFIPSHWIMKLLSRFVR